MYKILIISSTYTGHGHMSITTSLEEQFNKLGDVEVSVVDGFTLAGRVGVKVSKMYGPMTHYSKELWELIFILSQKRNSTFIDLVSDLIEDSFLQIYKIVKPDLIISVHANFVTSILNIINKNNIIIPFVTVIADIVSISSLWVDKRCDLIICPSIESAAYCKKLNVPEEKLLITGFPVRERFTTKQVSEEEPVQCKYNPPLNCLIMSGGEGVGNMRKIANVLLSKFNFKVTVIAGRNKLLKKRLETSLGEKYGDRLDILGFVDNVQDYMIASDIVLLRGSPNSIMEAVNCYVPVLVTGALPGQEEGNPSYVSNNNLGVVCGKTRNLTKVVNSLLVNNYAKLVSIRKSQKEFVKSNAAKEITQAIIDLLKKKKENIQNDNKE